NRALGPKRRPLKAPKRLLQEGELYSSLISLAVLCRKDKIPALAYCGQLSGIAAVPKWLRRLSGLPQKLRQLGDIRRDPPRLVLREHAVAQAGHQSGPLHLARALLLASEIRSSMPKPC